MPVPPPPPLTSTRVPGPAPAVPCSAMAPAWGIVDASTKVSAAGFGASTPRGSHGELGEPALEPQVVAVDLVAGPEAS